MNRRICRPQALIPLFLVAGFVSCKSDSDEESSEGPSDFTEETHGKDTAPNYDVLFTTTEVHTIEISIGPENFETMQQDLATLLESAGQGLGMGGGLPADVSMGGLPPELTAACEGLSAGDTCELDLMGTMLEGTCEASTDDALACTPASQPGVDGAVPDMGASAGGIDFLSEDPVTVPVDVHFDGHTWAHVGMRYKGNSSLIGSYQAGNGKLAFRLDFDEFEDTYPEIEDQRFYGFKKMTFSSGWSDDSLIRDAYVSEVLRDRGIPAARCAFYRVFVDVGEGSEYWGLYTMIEDPADGAMLDAQFGSREGNLYKPEGTGADFTTFDEAGFEKKTNEEAADWSDIEGAIAALHADPSDPEAWRAELEETFDVDLFLNWLAVSTTIVNWDRYGQLAHNYYLYALPGSKVLQWIPWDHNLAMMEQGGLAPVGGTDLGTAYDEVFHTNVGENWPLISFLLADPVYLERYRQALELSLEGLFSESAGPDRMRKMHELISPFVVGEEGEREGYSHVSSEQAFLESIDSEGGLADHVVSRHARVEEALSAE